MVLFGLALASHSLVLVEALLFLAASKNKFSNHTKMSASRILPFLVLAVTVFHQDKFFEVIDLELLEEFVEVFELLGSQPLKNKSSLIHCKLSHPR